MQYVKTSEVKTKKEYLDLVPRLNEHDDLNLDHSIKENGIREPLVFNQDHILLDGHSRLEKAKKYSIDKIPFIIKKFTDRLLEKKYVIECNLERRHLTNFQKIELGIPLLEIEKKLSEQRKILAGKLHGKGKKNSLAEIDANLLEYDIDNLKGKSAEKVAKKLGLSTSTLERGIKVERSASDEDKDKLRKGNSELSINKVYKTIRKKEEKKKVEDILKKNQLQLPDSVTLHHSRFQDIKLEPNSVSLIITDPPYDEKSLHLYKDLAKQAMEVLRDGGSLLTYAGHFCIDRVMEYMKEAGLKYHWLIVVLHSGNSASVFGRRILVAYKPMLWFTKGDYKGNFVKDVIKSEFQGKELHEWAQSTIESDYYIKYMTLEGEIVYDPFMGSGVFGASAVKLKRQFIGAEIDKGHFENAKKIIALKSQ